jgi:hypothetical protein
MWTEIETADDYRHQESRLSSISSELKDLSESDSVDLPNVITMRDEARVIAINLKNYINKNFQKQ